jgi:hypothetical protein
MSNVHASKTWPTWGAFRAEFESLPNSFCWMGNSKGFQGVRNLGEARALADKGWAEGMVKARAVALPAVETAAREVVESPDMAQDVTGAAFDIGGYLSGEPECWARPDVVDAKPAIVLTANLSASGGIPAEMLTLRGTAVAALALALQTGGYAVKVYVVMGCPVGEYSGPGTFIRVCLTDDTGGVLDLDRLVYALAHPSSLRVWGFLALARAAGKPIDTFPDLGIPLDPPAELGWAGDLYLPAATLGDADWASPASVEAWVKGQYAKLTAPKG